MEHGIAGPLGRHVERAGHAQHGRIEFRAVSCLYIGDGSDLLVRPGTIETETSGTAEEFWRVSYHEDRLDAHTEPSDLAAALSRHAHPKDCLRAFRSDRIPLVCAVQIGLREDHVHFSTGLPGDLVGRVLDEFEKLPVAVSALGDTTFSVGVLGHKAGVDGIGLQYTGGLFENGFDNRGGRPRRHFSSTPVASKVREGDRERGPAVRFAGPSASVVVRRRTLL
ncbi:hypothetical protein OHO81_27030 [Streptomyces pseudovenezuelae]|nr:hypothetical protein [Streptomyces pseudovenezuelae]WUA90715.1 hypothetical protein OHO81_27030 [Streptomyces pseudovenezuelae]